jgi:hypothetical protein
MEFALIIFTHLISFGFGWVIGNEYFKTIKTKQ